MRGMRAVYGVLACMACCVLWRDGAHGRWAARGGMRTSNSFAIEDDLGVAELRMRRRGCSRDHVQLRRLKAVGLRVLAGAGRPSVGRGARRDRSCCGIGADPASTPQAEPVEPSKRLLGLLALKVALGDMVHRGATT